LLILFTIPLTGRVIDDYYFWFPYLPVAASVLPYYLYSEDSERKWLIITLGYYLFILLVTDNILNFYADESLSILPIVKGNALFYKLSAALIFLFINITRFHIFKTSFNYEKSLIKAKELLDKKNNELEIKNADLNRINATKDKFFHIIGHDLRSPIAQIIQIANLLEDKENKLSESNYENIIKALKKSSLAGYSLLNDLFNWAQTQTGEIVFSPVAVNIYRIVNENIHLFHENASFKEITVINRVSETYTAFADVNMLNTIVRNLLSNAIKFTFHGGMIEITDEIREDGIEISIKDNGIGILPEDLDKLFKIDAKLSVHGTEGEKGTGIGLILCKEFINYHKGDIWVKSEPGKGTVFTIYLPSENASVK
jgi:signal transduction histidine kinase